MKDLQVLGSVLDQRGSAVAAWDHRSGKATTMFWKYSRLVMGRASTKLKLQAWDAAVRSSAFLDMGTTAANTLLLKRVQAFEHNLHLKMFGLKRRPSDDGEQYHRRTAHFLSLLHNQCMQKSMARAYLRNVCPKLGTKNTRIIRSVLSYYKRSETLEIGGGKKRYAASRVGRQGICHGSTRERWQCQAIRRLYHRSAWRGLASLESEREHIGFVLVTEEC